MGYYSGWNTRAELIAHITNPDRITAPFYKAGHEKAGQAFDGGVICWPGNGDDLEHKEVGNQVTLAKFASGNNLWCVKENSFDDGRTEGRFIILYAISGHNGSREGWGYKPVTESMGPYQVSCPLKFLDMVPEPERPQWQREYDKELRGGKTWRDLVREYWASRKLARPLKVGDVYELRPGFTVNRQPLTTVTITRVEKKSIQGDNYIRLTRPFLSKNAKFLYNKYDNPPITSNDVPAIDNSPQLALV